jgi:diguanylate cyclase (GGDEF)-like protein
LAAEAKGQERLAALRALLWAIAIAGLALACHGRGWLTPLQYVLEDSRFATSKRSTTGSLVVVQIDPPSISHYGPWPWPRGVHAQIVDELVALGATDIALDIDFSSPSEPQEDEKLAAALRRAGGNVILPAFKQATFATDGAHATIANLPIEILAQDSWPASVNVLADADGKVRRIASFDKIGEQTVPALGVLLAGFPYDQKSFRIDYGIDPSTIDHLSVADLLQHKIEPDRIRGKKVVIGATALELRDYVLVPVHGFISGPLLHAIAAETLLQKRLLRSPDNSWIIASMIVGAILGGVLLARKSWLWTLGSMLGTGALVEIVALWAYEFRSVLVDTSGIQFLFCGISLAALVQEIDLAKINLWLARTETRNLRAVLGRVVTDNFDGIVIADESGVIEASSARAAEILELPTEALAAGKQIRGHVPPELIAAMSDAIEQHRRGTFAAWSPAECILKKASAIRVLEYVVTPSRLESKGAVWRRGLVDQYVACLTFRDITEQRRLEQETFRLARYSELTNLPNRNALHEKLRQPQATPLAVMVVDIDRFRSINTTLGHDYGDSLLRAVANRISSCSAEVKFAAHLGGDDFAVLIGDWTTGEELTEIANLFIFAMSQPYAIEMRQLHVSFSAGLFICPAGMSNPIAAVMRADNALLAAKRSGGDTCKFYDEAVTAGVAYHQSLELDLWAALDEGQFNVLYQPQVNLFTNEMIGAEALLRWEHPTRGPISPAEFIPLAELTGMIVPLGRWVLDRACKDAAPWPKGCKIAVNLSARQLSGGGNLINDIDKVLASSGLASERLELEVTEGVFMQSAAHIVEAMSALQRRGISLSLDDFGMGYSSLSYLSNFPFNKLKIDKSFIAEIDRSETSRAIVKTIISLAQRINVSVIAEGVETLEQVKILQLLGCREGQGFYYSRPQTAQTVAQMLSQPIYQSA